MHVTEAAIKARTLERLAAVFEACKKVATGEVAFAVPVLPEPEGKYDSDA